MPHTDARTPPTRAPPHCTGLFLAYWADKWVALRRAASPGNLGGSALAGVVGPWLRALPLVQLVLIRFLYFKVTTGK